MVCLPILINSPIVTIWCGQDIVVYLGVLIAFVSALLYGTRRIIGLWSDWYLRIPLVTESEIEKWYVKHAGTPNAEQQLADTVDLAGTPFPRQALLAAIVKDQGRSWWRRTKVDDKVRRLSNG